MSGQTPQIYSIAAHRGFADALVAGLVPRYSEEQFGLARLTLLLPSSRAMRTVNEAFIRHYGAQGGQGMLMPRMAVVGDLDLDEALGSLLDPLGALGIPAAVEPTRRWLTLADIIPAAMARLGMTVPNAATVLRLARQQAETMDRLLAEEISPEQLWEPETLTAMEGNARHWEDNTKLFYAVQKAWQAELENMGRIDAASRRNRLYDHAAETWKDTPPQTPVVAAGVTSAAPALARLLKVVSQLPGGAVILPDFDLALDDEVWDELGAAGGSPDPGRPVFERGDAVTHPQYHLKLLLNRMGIARGEVQQWHRKGLAAAPPERTHAISSLFLPPEASKSWVDLPPEKRRLSGVRIMETANPETEAQAVALLVRQALEEPEKRVSVITPDRGLARRIVQHLRRWHIEADDSAGRPLSQTAAGRLYLLLAEVMAERAAPVQLLALLQHPLVKFDDGRGDWLKAARQFERALRGPRPAPGLDPLKPIAEEVHVSEWFTQVCDILQPLLDANGPQPLEDFITLLSEAGELLCGDALWSREDGRALSAFIEDLRLHCADTKTGLEADELYVALRDAMEAVAVRPPYGGHPRVSIYGLLESRMSRADLVICAGLNEGSWPATPSSDPLLAPPVLRALGVPGADFRIGLSAHDLAGALGAPEVVLSRAERDMDGPAIPSRFLLRVKALLGDDLIDRHIEQQVPKLAAEIDNAERAGPYEVPQPCPTPEQRKQRISVTALDRLRSDPYQFYAGSILRLKELDTLDARPSPAWQGTAAHEILENWHKTGRPMVEVAEEGLRQMNSHPLMRALWQPRLMRGLEWVEDTIAKFEGRKPRLFEEWAEMIERGVTIFGKVDRIDELEDGGLAIVDYKTGKAPSNKEVAAGYALQLGTIGLMAQKGAFPALSGTPEKFEYWSLAKSDNSETGFGSVSTPVKKGQNRSNIMPEDFLPQAQAFLDDALDTWILGDAPFTARQNPDAKVYATYDQLMRLEEWMGREE
ncbi:double-strand break repair protein AddB [Pontixanthobacter luteolus]|uniref:double-strand break repair protein AddB n=1 Tax=Pontixanthobacter luteolus TaxID=295089 RepID=UPI0023024427|nr:double-strand break repair protein AddB [Pontixanthobacter luteolus]